ncbi:zinc ribbon domain-containing protein [Salinispora vitiensis]|uniref:zinc ribbon domain-containing protein n=1 Tax=Salinispora vitiensis TaxID=999544 RepID=UPI00037AD5BF|nr:zinc ribbon domain-containing protein [Salinispora vitiensis]
MGPDYDLTGLITCSTGGLKYIGTFAQGRSRTYRYYTCSSHIRHGSHGCDVPRLPAEAIYQAVLAALLDLYSDTNLSAGAIRAERPNRAGQLSHTEQNSPPSQKAIGQLRRDLAHVFRPGAPASARR